jgi:DNA-binding CsgD family transcriptional regulator
MPVLLLCAFLVASAGLAATILAGVAFARRPSRSLAAFLCLVIASWLLALDLGISDFSWQTGASLHVWFRRFSAFATRAELALVPLAGCLFTVPSRKDGPVTVGRRLAFAFSLAATAIALVVSLAVVPAFTRAALANADATWVAAFSFIALVALAGLAFDRARLAREGTFYFVVIAGALSPVFALAPFAFRRLTLNDDAIPLALSALVSLAAIVGMPLASGKAATGRRAEKSVARKNAGPETESEHEKAAHPTREIPKPESGSVGNPAWVLSARETEIASLIAEGKTNGEIAAALFISQKTVETHLYNIFRKTGVTNRVQLARALLSARQ